VSSVKGDYAKVISLAQTSRLSKERVGKLEWKRMAAHANLISGSLLVMETIDYLVSVGGSARAASVVEYVMNIRNANDAMSRMLVADLADRDPRIIVDIDTVSLNEPDHDAIELAQASFVVLDLETTGAKAPPCRIIEIGAYRVANGVIVDEFVTLVNPETDVPEFITSLTGITASMVACAPRFESVLGNLLDFLGNSILVAHNSPFDLAFLNHEIARVHEDCCIWNPVLCTVELSRTVLPDVENHKLRTLADYYSVDLVNHHRAGDDAHATAKIFINLLESMHEQGIRSYGAARKFGRKKHYARRQAAA
jgi:DNA polymerase-3 subunit alpha (Gram-positive type)